MVKVKNWVCWLGIASSITILFIVVLIGKSECYQPGTYYIDPIDNEVVFVPSLMLKPREYSQSVNKLVGESTKNVLFLLAWGLLPAFVSVFTSLAERFWLNLVIGLWFLFISILGIEYVFRTAGDTSAMVFLLAALSLSSTPILNMIFGKKTTSKTNNSIKSE